MEPLELSGTDGITAHSMIQYITHNKNTNQRSRTVGNSI